MSHPAAARDEKKRGGGGGGEGGEAHTHGWSAPTWSHTLAVCALHLIAVALSWGAHSSHSPCRFTATISSSRRRLELFTAQYLHLSAALHSWLPMLSSCRGCSEILPRAREGLPPLIRQIMVLSDANFLSFYPLTRGCCLSNSNRHFYLLLSCSVK